MVLGAETVPLVGIIIVVSVGVLISVVGVIVVIETFPVSAQTTKPVIVILREGRRALQRTIFTATKRENPGC